MLRNTITIVLLSIFLTACGTTPEERAVSGAGVGAGAGAVVGAVTGATVLGAAALGAAAGAATGAVTDDDDVDLGKPAWE